MASNAQDPRAEQPEGVLVEAAGHGLKSGRSNSTAPIARYGRKSQNGRCSIRIGLPSSAPPIAGVRPSGCDSAMLKSSPRSIAVQTSPTRSSPAGSREQPGEQIEADRRMVVEGGLLDRPAVGVELLGRRASRTCGRPAASVRRRGTPGSRRRACRAPPLRRSDGCTGSM